jgi:hypothetical protein
MNSRLLHFLNCVVTFLVIGFVIFYASVIVPVVLSCFVGALLVLWLICNAPWYACEVYKGFMKWRRRP